jgi:hypothetical protein
MDNDRPLLKGVLWSKMSEGDKGGVRKSNFQDKATHKLPVNTVGHRTRGVSLEMLAQSGLIVLKYGQEANRAVN